MNRLVQIQNNPNDIADNTASPYRQQYTRYADWRVTAIILVSLIVIWIIGLLTTSMQCTYAVACVSFSIILYAPLVLLLVFLSVIGIVYAIMMYHTAQKARLANALTQQFDYKDASKLAPLTIAVAHQLAKSEGLRGLDNFTYSPSNSTNHSASNAQPAAILDDTPLDLVDIDVTGLIEKINE